MSYDNIFKFMTIRPPQKLNDEAIYRHFIEYSFSTDADDNFLSSLCDILRTRVRLDGNTKAKELAVRYIEQNIKSVLGNVYAGNILKNILAYVENDAINTYPSVSVFRDQIADIILQQKFYTKNIYTFDTPNDVKDIRSFLRNINAINEFANQRRPSYKDTLWRVYFAFCVNTNLDPVARQELTGYIRVINLLEKLVSADDAPEITDIADVKTLMDATPVLPSFFAKAGDSVPWAPSGSPRQSGQLTEDVPVRLDGSVRSIGLGEVKTVRQTLVRYEMGEIAHIENILRNERKERNLRVLDKTEETVETETETETTETKDSQSTDRYEVQREIAKQVSTDMNLNTGISISASYGPTVSVNSDTNFGYSQSKQESNRVSTNYAREAVNKAVSSISEKIREAKTKTVIREVEETNTHEVNNIGGTGHISGVYRWVDKIYKMQVMDIGEKRMMYEFIVPEPAAQYIHLDQNKVMSGVRIGKPEPPQIIADGSIRELTPDDITDGSDRELAPGNVAYIDWAKKYGVTGVDMPPAEYVSKSTFLGYPVQEVSDRDSLVELSGAKWNVILECEPVNTPDGYYPHSAQISASTYRVDEGGAHAWILLIGTKIKVYDIDKGQGGSDTIYFDYPESQQNVDSVQLMVRTLYLWYFHADIDVVFARTKRLYQDWQMKTFMAIMDGYYALKARYDEQENPPDTSLFKIQGRNPDINRLIEKQELKRCCISMLRNHKLDFDYITQAANDSPEIDKAKMDASGGEILYLEQAFEWDNMLYVYYPYYYGRRANWTKIYSLADSDPQFEQFLKAGAARVVVPVRYNFDNSLITYITTGKAWNGGPAPVISDELYLSILAEIKEQTGGGDKGTPSGDPWFVKVPTTLIKLQETPELPVFEEV